MSRKDYKVFGDRVHKYYVTVNAESPDIAWEAAAGLETHQWEEVPIDNYIEPYEVKELEQIYELWRTKRTFRTKALGNGPKKYLTGVFTNSRN